MQGAQCPQAISGASPTCVPGGGNVDPRGEVTSDAPHACRDFVPEDHARGNAVRLLSRRDAQVRPAQRRCFDGKENVARAERRNRAFLEYQGAGGAERRCEHGFHAPSIGLVTIAGGAPFAHLSTRTHMHTIIIEHMFYIMGR